MTALHQHTCLTDVCARLGRLVLGIKTQVIVPNLAACRAHTID